ncbi:hypothetical protein CTAYLR_002094 [Chrysophaeum taylorii]|uniref:Embryonic stem cell-specific 5-hydroxymethylcytosine-binding protein n=1 Tax=Chrysophaeum taylorii TaxID=2483200 RepID=A0AAD7XPZ7_9STRA|nr:hypothetical protein CTAYLR_002094 [Chrysophaeum taylorii]
MCGRARAAAAETVQNAARAVGGGRSEPQWDDADRYKARPNAHPGQSLGSIVAESGVVRVCTDTWGLIPKGGGGDHFKMFNARSETAFVLRSFRELYRNGRAVVVLDGFYEWTEGALKEKQPHYAHRADGEPLLVAALRANGTCTLLTREVVPSLSWLHDRMPVIFEDAEKARAWLDDRSSEPFDFGSPPDLATHPVTKKMSKMNYQEDDASDPIKEPKKLTAFFKPTPAQTGATKRRGQPQTPPPAKRPAENKQSPPAAKGTITAFFEPTPD